ncbi:MAG: amidohydrolase family protein [Chitinophagaceae bacterium]|nr:amidohydrolase family protein [Chitinophagaceae bacterium]
MSTSKLIILKIIIFTILLSLEKNTNGQQIIEGIHYETGHPVRIIVNNGIIENVIALDNAVSDRLVYIAPGFFDNQVNGFTGISSSFGEVYLTYEGIEESTAELWKEGVTTYLPTLTTNSIEVLTRNFKLLSKALNDKKLLGSIPGFHLEGPYISSEEGYRGSHPTQFIKPPDWEEFLKLYKASGDRIFQITMAPETEGALDFISNCSRKGIVVALGHHNADMRIVSAAIDRGAKIATHLGNGAANMLNRHNNPLWPQLADDRLNISIICDSFHLLPEEIRVFYKVKGAEKTIITSDVTQYATLGPGIYKTSTGEELELTTNRMLRYPAQDVLYGSVSSISKGVGYVMRVTGCTLGEAFRMASSNPARLYNLNDRGVLEPGKRADIILFTIKDYQLDIEKTWVQGKLVYEK